jgi:ABC-type tungstate transport system substrate-binding protein
MQSGTECLADSPQSRPSRQEAPSDALMLPMVVQGLQSQIDAIQVRIEAQAAMMQAAQRERMMMFIWGAIAGLVGATLLLVAAYLLVTIGQP